NPGDAQNQASGADVGPTQDLADAPWRSATTGWEVLADQDVPIRNASFTWNPMIVAGEPFERGIGTYPFSEIVYDLDGRATRFSARVGLTDDSVGAGSVRFSVYGDSQDAPLFQSDVVRGGEPAREVNVDVQGLSRLRLVVDDAGDGSLRDYALWANPRVSLSDEAADPAVRSAAADAQSEREAGEARSRAAEETTLKERARADLDAFQQL